jgi:hypothetical protein
MPTNYGPGDYETMGQSARSAIDGDLERLYERYMTFLGRFVFEEPGAAVPSFEEWMEESRND